LTSGGPASTPTPSAGCANGSPPVIGAVTCQDIKAGHMQKIVNAAPTAGEGARVAGMISALVSAGIDNGDRDELMAYTAAYSGLRWAAWTATGLPGVLHVTQ
jgi:hypothetical protein